MARGEHNKTLATILTPYSLLLAPYFTACSLFCGARSARVFFVAKANEVMDASEASVGAERGESRKRIPHRVLISRKGVGRDLKIESVAKRFRVST